LQEHYQPLILQFKVVAAKKVSVLACCSQIDMNEKNDSFFQLNLNNILNLAHEQIEWAGITNPF
jgi:hypothetical protein